MDNGVLVVLVAIAMVASGIAVGLLIARRNDPGRDDLIKTALITVARTLGATLGDAEIRAVASWVYDAMGVSGYYSKDEWIAYCIRMLRRAEQTAVQAPEALRGQS